MSRPGRLLRVATLSLFRNGQRSSLTMAGVFVSIFVIVASLAALQVEGRAQVQRALLQLPWHLVGFTTGSDFDDLQERIGAEDAVFRTELVASSTIPVTLSGMAGNASLILNFVRPEFSLVADRFGVKGSSFGSSGIVLDRSASALGIRAGDTAAVSRTYIELNATGDLIERHVFLNVTVTAFFEVLEPSLFGALGGVMHAFAGFQSLDLMFSDLDIEPGGLDLRAFVELGLSAIVDPFDAKHTATELGRVKRNLEIATVGYGATFTFFEWDGLSLTSILARHYDEQVKGRMTTIALTLPLVALGVYASFLAATAAMGARLPEFAAFVSRGLSRRGLVSMQIVEAAMMGGIAGVFASLLGVLVVLFLYAVRIPPGLLEPTFAVIGVGALLGGVLLALSTASIIRRFVNLTSVEMIRGDARRAPVNPPSVLVNLLFLGFALSLLVLFVVLPSAGSQLPSVSGFFGSDVLASFLPYVPILMMLFVVRLALFHSDSVTRFLIRPFMWVTGELREIMAAMASHDLRKSERIVVVLALATALIVFTSVSLASFENYQIRILPRAVVGSDIRIVLQQENDTFATQVSSFPEVASVCAGKWFPGHEATLATFDERLYVACVGNVENYFDERSNVAAQLPDLRPGEAFVSTRFVELVGVTIGSEVVVRLTNLTGSIVPVRLRIVGIVKALPGLETPSDGNQVDRLGSESMVYVRADVISEPRNLLARGAYLLVKLRPGILAHGVVERIESIMPPDALVVSRSDLSESLARDSAYAGRASLLKSQATITAIGGSAGVGIIIGLTAFQRRHDFRALVSRGTTRGRVASLGIAATAPLIVAGGLLGLLAGMLGTMVHFIILEGAWPGALAPAVFLTPAVLAPAGILTAAIVVVTILIYVIEVRAMPQARF